MHNRITIIRKYDPFRICRKSDFFIFSRLLKQHRNNNNNNNNNQARPQIEALEARASSKFS
jgi:hypothetical protein